LVNGQRKKSKSVNGKKSTIKRDQQATLSRLVSGFQVESLIGRQSHWCHLDNVALM